MMTTEEIRKMAERHETLTEEEERILAEAIVENPETRKQAIFGAIISGRYDMAVELMMYDNSKEDGQDN
jgi:hypothetical protein